MYIKVLHELFRLNPEAEQRPPTETEEAPLHVKADKPSFERDTLFNWFVYWDLRKEVSVYLDSDSSDFRQNPLLYSGLDIELPSTPS